MNRVSGAVAAGLSVALLGSVAACTSADDETPSTSNDFDVRVMQFNIEYGGNTVDFDSVPAAITAADADVVALQEGYGKTCKVAAALEWPYCDPRTQTVSKYPLLTPADPAGHEVLVAPQPGAVFGVVNLHLPSAPYGPNKAVAGASAEELIGMEKGRVAAIEPVLEASSRLQDEGIPVIVTGDFNAPSHRDWTEETAGTRDHVSAVEWPVSLKVEETGLVDTYRTAHPDPVEDPGLTWPAARPKAGSYNPGLTGKPADRIDITYTSPDITVEDSEIVGEESAEVTDIPVEPWPTDHRAVVSVLSIPLADPGAYVSPASRLVEQGDTIEVFGHADTEGAGVRITGGESGDVLEAELDGGVAEVDTAGLDVGESSLTLVTDEGEEVASGQLWVREPGAETEITTSQAKYKQGDPIEIEWTNAPGNKWDWLGVYKQGADPNIAYYKNWAYTDATIAGEGVIDESAKGGPWPLPPGSYDILLLADDSYAELARTTFTVTN